IARRAFIAGLGGAAAWSVAARAQQGDRVRRIGVLMPGDENDPEWKNRLSALTKALADLGWNDGRNLRIDFRWFGDDTNRIRAVAQELASLQPDITMTQGPRHHDTGTPPTAALQQETRTIPIVASLAEPVASGIVPGLKEPGGNVTGFALYETTLAGKWLEMLSEVPHVLKRDAIMFNHAATPVSSFMPLFAIAARSLKAGPLI